MPTGHTVTFNQYQVHLDEFLKYLEDVGIPIEGDIAQRAQNAFHLLYHSTFPLEKDRDLTDARIWARDLAGLGDFAFKINRALKQPGADTLEPHIREMVKGSVALNDRSTILDQQANKTVELYAGVLALCAGWTVTLEDPKSTGGGRNPDLILTRGSTTWSIAIKTSNSGASNPSPALFANIKGAVDQIERCTAAHGLVLVNLKNIVSYSQVQPPENGTYRSIEAAIEAATCEVDRIVKRLRTDIVDEDWRTTFEGKKARPIVAFMAHFMLPAWIPAELSGLPSPQSLKMPIRVLTALGVPPHAEALLEPADAAAHQLLEKMNIELQRTPRWPT